VAKVLAKIVEQEQPELVIMGKQSIDGDNNQCGQMLAALTGRPQGTFASEVTLESDSIKVTREIDSGLQTIKLSLPAVVTTDLRLNEPRFASLPNIMKAKKKPLDIIELDSLGIDTAARTKMLSVDVPAQRSAGIKLASVEELVEKLKTEAKVLS